MTDKPYVYVDWLYVPQDGSSSTQHMYNLHMDMASSPLQWYKVKHTGKSVFSVHLNVIHIITAKMVTNIQNI